MSQLSAACLLYSMASKLGIANICRGNCHRPHKSYRSRRSYRHRRSCCNRKSRRNRRSRRCQSSSSNSTQRSKELSRNQRCPFEYHHHRRGYHLQRRYLRGDHFQRGRCQAQLHHASGGRDHRFQRGRCQAQPLRVRGGRNHRFQLGQWQAQVYLASGGKDQGATVYLAQLSVSRQLFWSQHPTLTHPPHPAATSQPKQPQVSNLYRRTSHDLAQFQALELEATA